MSCLNPFSRCKREKVPVGRMSIQGVKRIYVDGGLTIQSFLAKNLISEITITLIPIILGSGKPLFTELAQDIHLKLMKSKSYSFGFVQNKYQVIECIPICRVNDD